MMIQDHLIISHSNLTGSFVEQSWQIKTTNSSGNWYHVKINKDYDGSGSSNNFSFKSSWLFCWAKLMDKDNKSKWESSELELVNDDIEDQIFTQQCHSWVNERGGRSYFLSFFISHSILLSKRDLNSTSKSLCYASHANMIFRFLSASILLSWKRQLICILAGWSAI